MTALVTGAAGFIGRHLLDALKGQDVVPLDLHPVAGHDRCVVCDLSSVFESVPLVVRTVKPTVVYHLAGRIVGDTLDVWRANVMGTINLLDAVRREAPGARVVVVGSAAEYGRQGSDPIREAAECRPVGTYATSKHAAVLAALDAAKDVDVVVARPFNIVGHGMGAHLAAGRMIAEARAALDAGSHVMQCRGVDLQRDFLAVHDVASALIALAEHGRRGEIYNVCSGQPVTFRTLFNWLSEASGLGIEEWPTPADAIPFVVGDNKKIERDTGWAPAVPLRDALMQAWGA